MKTLLDKRKKEYIRIQQNSSTQEPSKNEPFPKEAEMEVQMIHMSPSYLGMPMWKFFFVKDKK